MTKSTCAFGQCEVRYGGAEDLELIAGYDGHISKEELGALLEKRRVLILTCGVEFAGWLRYNLFWDNTPFMNMLYLLEKYRGQGLGALLTERWEEDMRALGFSLVLTSSLSNERAQFFYRRHGYVDCGSLLLESEALEIIFQKKI